MRNIVGAAGLLMLATGICWPAAPPHGTNPPKLGAPVILGMARLNANQKGSFRIRAYIETSGTRRFQNKEPSIPLNLVLADASVVADNSVANSGSLAATVSPSGVAVANGTWPAAAIGP